MTAATSQLPYSSAAVHVTPGVRSVHRHICPESGHALEILSHAIEYLTDELVVAPGSLDADHGRIEAIELLMSVNRRIYNDCPEIPPLAQRVSAWFRHFA